MSILVTKFVVRARTQHLAKNASNSDLMALINFSYFNHHHTSWKCDGGQFHSMESSVEMVNVITYLFYSQ